MNLIRITFGAVVSVVALRVASGAVLISILMLCSHTAISEENTHTDGVQAYIDPETGELSSEAPAVKTQQGQAQAAASVEQSEFEVIDHPDGMQEVRLNGHMNSDFTVTIKCDGSLETGHGGHAEKTHTTDCEQ